MVIVYSSRLCLLLSRPDPENLAEFKSFSETVTVCPSSSCSVPGVQPDHRHGGSRHHQHPGCHLRRPLPRHRQPPVPAPPTNVTTDDAADSLVHLGVVGAVGRGPHAGLGSLRSGWRRHDLHLRLPDPHGQQHFVRDGHDDGQLRHPARRHHFFLSPHLESGAGRQAAPEGTERPRLRRADKYEIASACAWKPERPRTSGARSHGGSKAPWARIPAGTEPAAADQIGDTNSVHDPDAGAGVRGGLVPLPGGVHDRTVRRPISSHRHSLGGVQLGGQDVDGVQPCAVLHHPPQGPAQAARHAATSAVEYVTAPQLPCVLDLRTVSGPELQLVASDPPLLHNLLLETWWLFYCCTICW